MRATADSKPLIHDLAGRGDGRHPGRYPVVAIVHPGVFPATVYQRLAAELAAGPVRSGGFAVCVLDLTGVDEYWHAAMRGERAEVSVEQIAERFAGALAEHAPQGPAVLVGWSFGGVIAYELARRLPARPELLLLDSIAPTERLPRDLTLATPVLLSWFAMYLGAKRGGSLRLGEDRFALTSLDEGLAVVRDAAAERGVLARDTPMAGLRKLYDTYIDGLVRNTQLTDAYRARPTDRELTLVKAEGSLRPASRDLGWSALADGGLRVRTCPGDHYSMLGDPAAAGSLAGFVREQAAETKAPRTKEVAQP